VRLNTAGPRGMALASIILGLAAIALSVIGFVVVANAFD
jgi:hypothetical protein